MKSHELFTQLRKQSKLHTQVLSRLFYFKTWCIGAIWNWSNFPDKYWQWSLNISSQSRWEQHHTIRPVPSSSRTSDVRWDFYFNTSHERSPWTNCQWHYYDQGLDEAPRGVTPGHKSFLALKDSMPSTTSNFSTNILQQSCVLASLQGLGFNRRCRTQAAVCAYGLVTVHRGICPSMSAI